MAYAIYIDESYDKKSDYTIMAGFIVPLDKWKKLDKEVENLKIDFFSDPNMNLKSIRRKKYDKKELWESLSVERKKEFNKRFYDLIAVQDYTIIICLINNKKMDDKKKDLFFYLAYGFIVQRYQYFLSSKNDQGIVIMDIAEASAEIKDLFYAHKKFMREGVPTKRKDFQWGEYTIKDYERLQLDNLAENLIFLDDSKSNMLQIVDMIAAATFANFNRGYSGWYEKIENIIRCDENGNIEGYGLKSFP